jgi:hypothetical protein
VFVAGITVLLLGIVMLVAPGPGILTIALGLGILATKFLWARRLLKRFREKGTKLAARLFRKAAAISSVVHSQARHTRGKLSQPHTVKAMSGAVVECPRGAQAVLLQNGQASEASSIVHEGLASLGTKKSCCTPLISGRSR